MSKTKLTLINRKSLIIFGRHKRAGVIEGIKGSVTEELTASALAGESTYCPSWILQLYQGTHM